MRNNKITYLVSIAVAFLAMALFPVCAQDNPYKIDNECYEAYNKLGFINDYSKFKDALNDYYNLCESRHDMKAEILGDVLLYRNSLAHDTESDYLALYRKLKGKFLTHDFMQYYYYLDALLVTKYINSGMYKLALGVASDMEVDAVSRKNDYGIYTSYKNLANIFMLRNDYRAQRLYLKQALEYSEKVPDQSVCRICLDLADSYLESNYKDSCLLYLLDAERNMKAPGDTATVYGNLARYYALENDWPQMDRFMGLYKEYIGKYSSTRSEKLEGFLAAASYVRSQRWTAAKESANGILDTYERFRTHRFVAMCKGDYEDACAYSDSILMRWQFMNEQMHFQEVEQTSVQFGLNRLAMEKQNADARAQRFKKLCYYSGLVLLLLIIFFTSYSAFKQKKVNRRLTDLKNEAEKANSMKTMFIQNMSHEIRTPLNAIVGFSQLLGLPEGFLSEEEKAAYSEYVKNNSNMLTMLIDDILNLSDVENGQYNMKMTTFHFNSLCEMAMKSVEYRVQAGVNLYFTTELQESDLIHSDERRVQQVLVNLLSNACKHTERGEIHVHVSLKEIPGMLAVSVADTGPGVPPGREEEIFDRFTKLNNSKQGAGLGLNICRIIAERLDGRIYLDTSYTNGARFVFVIPYLPDGDTV